MVRIDGKLYYDTGRESIMDARCGTMDGEITSTVDGTEIPVSYTHLDVYKRQPLSCPLMKHWKPPSCAGEAGNAALSAGRSFPPNPTGGNTAPAAPGA